MPETFLSDIDLGERYRVTRQTIWRWHREQSDFPRAISLSPGCTRWRLSHVESWERAKAEAA